MSIETKERTTLDDEDKDCVAVSVARYRWACKHVVGRVLDLGCGSGYGAEMLSVGSLVTAVDKDLSQAETSNSAIKWIQADTCDTGLESETFDAVVCFEVIEHLNNPRALLVEALRMLKPGGRLILSTPNRVTCPSEITNPFHIHVFKLDELRTLMLWCGFKDISFYGVSLPKDRGWIGAIKQRLVAIRRSLGIKRLTAQSSVPSVDSVRILQDDYKAPNMLFTAVKP